MTFSLFLWSMSHLLVALVTLPGLCCCACQMLHSKSTRQHYSEPYTPGHWSFESVYADHKSDFIIYLTDLSAIYIKFCLNILRCAIETPTLLHYMFRPVTTSESVARNRSLLCSNVLKASSRPPIWTITSRLTTETVTLCCQVQDELFISQVQLIFVFRRQCRGCHRGVTFAHSAAVISSIGHCLWVCGTANKQSNIQTNKHDCSACIMHWSLVFMQQWQTKFDCCMVHW